jgi:hypothetical protein
VMPSRLGHARILVRQPSAINSHASAPAFPWLFADR